MRYYVIFYCVMGFISATIGCIYMLEGESPSKIIPEVVLSTIPGLTMIFAFWPLIIFSYLILKISSFIVKRTKKV
jgi:hypothetical protein